VKRFDYNSTGCYTERVIESAGKLVRAFKTAWFSKAARKALIKDSELCSAIQKVMQGLADDLGGGVFKTRLNKNMHRSIILAKGGKHWIFEYLFAKKDRDNIEEDELEAFRALAKQYEKLSDDQLAQLLQNEDFMEICHGNKAQV